MRSRKRLRCIDKNGRVLERHVARTYIQHAAVQKRSSSSSSGVVNKMSTTDVSTYTRLRSSWSLPWAASYEDRSHLFVLDLKVKLIWYASCCISRICAPASVVPSSRIREQAYKASAYVAQWEGERVDRGERKTPEGGQGKKFLMQGGAKPLRRFVLKERRRSAMAPLVPGVRCASAFPRRQTLGPTTQSAAAGGRQRAAEGRKQENNPRHARRWRVTP
ncbi:unnamed protein product, partial [Amoebophrya sp. A120]|eukprot:GSA120T00022581001.1